MFLYEYDLVSRMLRAGLPEPMIVKASGVSSRLVRYISQGARVPGTLLLHNTGEYSLCPTCHRRVLLPCFSCFCESKEATDCIEIIPRPARNHERPLQFTLDVLLLREEEDEVDEYDDDD